MQVVLRVDNLMLTQKEPISSVSVGAFSGATPPSFVGSKNRLVIKEQVFADASENGVTRSCENPKRPYLWANDTEQKRMLIVRPDCKTWACPGCAEKNRRRWAVRVYQGIVEYQNEGRAWWHATITLRQKRAGLVIGLATWRDAWPRLYNRMKRMSLKAGNPVLRYVLLPELAPESGRFHVHMLLNDPLGASPTKSKRNPFRSDWLKDNGAAVGLGYMNDIRPIENASIASWYVSKYVGKSLGVEDWPEHFRRVRVSVDWPELKTEESIGDNLQWNVANERKICEIVSYAWDIGYDAVSLNTGEMIEYVDLEWRD